MAHLRSMDGLQRTLDELADEFALLPDWEERIAHVIEMARTLEPLSEEERNENTRVRGCVSRVWLVCERRPEHPGLLFFRGDSDAHLVRGEIAMLLRIFSGRPAAEIAAADPRAVFEKLGLKDALTMQRSNGLFAMMNRMQQAAKDSLAG